MNQMNSISIIDVRTIVPIDRHKVIFETFKALKTGESMEIVNDHHPTPLKAQFSERFIDAYQWDYLQEGPDLWRVKITKVSDDIKKSTCCGHCGG